MDRVRTQELCAWLDARLSSLPEQQLLGRGYQAVVHAMSTPYGDIVVKTAHSRGPIGRLARCTLHHEARVYAQLGAVPGIPACLGLLRGRHLVLERIAGLPLRGHERTLTDPTAFHAALLATLDAMHAAGIAHGDLKRKNNILIGPGERPFLIDFGIAWRCPPGAPAWRRVAFRTVAQMDYNAWMKHKHGRPPYGPEIPPADLARYHPLFIERLARGVRIPWQALTFRHQRHRQRDRD